MGPKTTKCGVCGEPSKYRCSACPVRYCSVACYKTHKQDSCVASASDAAAAPAPSLGPEEPAGEAPKPDEEKAEMKEEEEAPLRPLTSLKWPPEPDAMVFSDPLRRDDPKPLRHAELERVATSKPLRDLLASPALTKLLTALDALPTSNARHASLARLLGVDNDSLSQPAAAATLDRGSPPPLGDLLAAAAGHGERRGDEWGADGWWLGRGEGRVWIGPEERQLVKLWAGVVVNEIDGEDREGAWGQGELAWEV